MTRTLYGGTGADVLLGDANSDNIPEFATSTYTVWTTRTGSTQVTDLQTFPGAAATSTVSAVGGRIMFYGPDSFNASLWLRDEAAPTATRWLVLPSDVADRSGVTDHHLLTNLTAFDDHTQYLNNARGDARYVTPAQAAAGYVALTGAQTVAGVKTFSAAPVIPDASLTIAKTNTLQAALDAKVAKSGSVTQLADVPDTVLAPGETYTGDGSGLLEPLDVSDAVAAFDTTTGDLLYTAFAPYMILGFIKDEGDPDPAGLPLGAGIPIIGFSRPAAASIIPIFDDESVGLTSNGSAVPFVTTQDYAVGEDMLVVVGASGEAGTGGFPAEATVAFGAGAGTTAMRVRGTQAGTAQVAHYHVKVTTHVPVGTNVTVTFRDTTNAANQNRAIWATHLVKMPNLTATPFDQSVGVGAGQDGVLSKSVGPTGATAVAREVALMSVFMSGGAPPAVKAMSPGSGWNLLRHTEEDSATSSRLLMTAYKVLSATGAVTGNYSVGPSGVGTFDSVAGGHADVISTYKGS